MPYKMFRSIIKLFNIEAKYECLCIYFEFIEQFING